MRDARPADVPDIWRLVLELADYERLSHAVSGSSQELESSLFGAAPECMCWVLEIDHTVVGYAIAFRTYSTFKTRAGLWLEDLYVTPTYRGKGHGKELLSHVLEVGRSLVAGRIEWSVLDWNESAIKFYKSMGAQVLPDWRICRVETSS